MQQLSALAAALWLAVYADTGAPAPVEATAIQDLEILGDDSGLVLDALHFRFTTFDQKGHGYQSRAGRPGEKGSEELLVWQPMALVVLRHGAFRHEVSLPVDVVSSASADALDAISTASRHNEAGSIDVTTTYAFDDALNLSLRYGGHVEENFRSVFGGAGFDYSFAEDNAAVGASFSYNFDEFDPVTHLGRDPGNAHRITVSGNMSFSQVLSPTTIAAFSYGSTYQQGVLQQTWNSVPIVGTIARAGEVFPRSRWRHAMSAELAQHIPFTHTSLHASYRYYFDSWELKAHTIEALWYQYLSPDLYVRTSWRYYTQGELEFFMTSLPSIPRRGQGGARTADSDLAPFGAHEVGVKVVLLLQPMGVLFDGGESIDLSYFRYVRDNDLSVNVVSIAYGGRF